MDQYILVKAYSASRQDEKTIKISVLDVGGKPQRVIPGKTHAVREGLKNPIHIVPLVRFEPGSQRLMVRQDTTLQT